jgi:hypothetical protein
MIAHDHTDVYKHKQEHNIIQMTGMGHVVYHLPPYPYTEGKRGSHLDAWSSK